MKKAAIDLKNPEGNTGKLKKLPYTRMYVLKEPPEGNTATRTEITEKKNPKILNRGAKSDQQNLGGPHQRKYSPS